MPNLTLTTPVKVLTIREGDLVATLAEAIEMVDENPSWHVQIPADLVPFGGDILGPNQVRALAKDLPRQ